METKGSTLVSEGSPTSAIIVGIKENMFENLTGKFEEIFSSLKKAPSLDENHVDEGLRKIRQALLEADVSLSVVKEFVEDVRKNAVGAEVVRGLNPGQKF